MGIEPNADCTETTGGVAVFERKIAGVSVSEIS
jgi:hypothetical protein